MTMHINLSPEMEGFIKDKVASGFYGNATEVIRDAVRRMQAEDGRIQALKAAIKRGDDELDLGKGVAYKSEALNKITKKPSTPCIQVSRWIVMSSLEGHRDVVLAPRARQDFIDILRYTGETWGEKQMMAYRDKIDEALRQLGGNLGIGHRRDDLPDTHLAYLVDSHLIIYRDQGTRVAVARILHQRMSIARHL